MALEDCLLKALNARAITASQADQIRKPVEEAEDSEIRFLEGFIQEKAEVKRNANLQVIATKRNLYDIAGTRTDLGAVCWLCR